MTYTMLPLRLRESLVGGIILSVTQIYTSLRYVEDTYQWQEVSKLRKEDKFTNNIQQEIKKKETYICFKKKKCD